MAYSDVVNTWQIPSTPESVEHNFSRLFLSPRRTREGSPALWDRHRGKGGSYKCSPSCACFLHLLALQLAEFPYVTPELLSGFEYLAIGKDPWSLSGPGSDGGYCFEQTEI